MSQKQNADSGRPGGSLPQIFRWLVPGLGVKRWIFPISLGIAMCSFGLAILALGIYRNNPNNWIIRLLATVSLSPLQHTLRGLIFGLLGVGLILFGIAGLNNSLLAPFRRANRPMLEELSAHRLRGRGAKIVALGGGHGLATLLRGLKQFSFNITAVVTVADDGGSSGRLRRSLGILPPGDIRNCLAALSDEEALLGKLFQYRFPGEDPFLEGHSFGNLFISALSDLMGSFERAVAESGKVLSVHGQVLPATLHDVRLVADLTLNQMPGHLRIEGESQIPEFSGKVNRVWLEPDNPPAYPLVIQALLSAEIIVVGPGSLYTSLLPNLLVRDIVEAIRASRAFKIFVCNLASQPGETDGYNWEDYLETIDLHTGGNLFDIILVNNSQQGTLPAGVHWVSSTIDSGKYHIYRADLVDSAIPFRHDPQKLAKIILDLYQERTGPLVE